MRLRIAHQLSLLLTAAVVLAVLAVGGVSLWSLRSGFGDYLRQRDEEQLTRFIQLLERRAAADPSMDWLRGNREAQRDLMDELIGRPIQPRTGRPEETTDERGEPPHRRRPPHRRPAEAGNIADRIVVLDVRGDWLAGRRQPPHLARTVRAVQVNGADVAFVELVAEREPEGIDARFLQRQTTGMLITPPAAPTATGHPPHRTWRTGCADCRARHTGRQPLGRGGD
ncbi:MAG: hypothetical protein NT071_17060 [Burkholderiales bacterium]|nr:hypothetical protein [Burkholderiales bacterium]